MSLSVAVQMDHIASIRLAGDSTFALMLEAQARGHRLYHYTPDRLSLRSGRVTAALEPVEVRDQPGNHFTLGPAATTDLAGLDVVLLRQDPPFDMAYLATTYLLERIHPKTLVVNAPTEVRNAPEKLLVMDFPELMPETLITRSPDEVKAFRAECGDIVIKPLYGAGGQGVYHVKPDDDNFSAFLELFLTQSRDPFIVQRYLPAVRLGDKRIVLVDGQYAGLVNRVPAKGDLRSNMVRGGAAEGTEVTKRDLEICEAIGPQLRKRGLIFVGIDVIGDKLTEINVTSPTGIRAIRRLGGPDIAALIWDAIEAKR